MSSSICRLLLLGSLCLLPACSGSDSGPSSPTEPTETPTPVILSLSPATLVEGGGLIIHGTDFSAAPSQNVVTIDGVTATVSGSTSTQLTVTVPTFDCLPQRTVDVRVRSGSKASNTVGATLQPDGFVDAAVGEMTLITDPEGFCLQFAPAAAGSGEYLVGMGAAAERPEELLDVSLVGVVGGAAPAAASAAASIVSQVGQWALREPPARTLPILDSRLRTRLSAHFQAEQRIRHWEREYLGAVRNTALASAAAPAPSMRTPSARAVPEVGDHLELKMPTWAASTLEAWCTPIPITAQVRAVGERGIFVADVNNPETDPLTDVEIQGVSDAFDSFIYDTNTRYFGTPSDLDGNQRIIVVLTVEVNKAVDGLMAGSVFLGDLFDPEDCPASDRGELYYYQVPDPDNAAGTGARTKEDVLGVLAPVLAHEFTHIIQLSRRLTFGPSSSQLALWEQEGQAMFAMEVAGHAAFGTEPGQDYGATTALSEPGSAWYQVDGLAAYYGYDGEGGRNPDAPETCTLLFRNQLSPTGCVLGAGYGAAWSFLRFLADRLGPDWPGGEEGLMRDWIDANPTLRGVANAEALLGRPFPEVFAEWAAMQYVDGRVPGADPDLLMSSWDLSDVMPAVDANAPLEPAARAFTDFGVTLSIRGGSTAYSLFGDEAPRPATAIRVRAPNGAVLGSDMKPQLWVVRTR